jgi:(R)-2-hydroxyacyl-CoA dehydratese activating ATPase
MITLGIDIGSITSKAALIKDKKISSLKIINTGYNVKKTADNIFEKILKEENINKSDINNIIATGYGRKRVDFAKKKVTEITCHAKGAFYLNKNIRSIIDIGGQDSKVIVIDKNGNVENFAMNDKCAAGTGRFLEVMAKALEVDINDFGKISLQLADNPEKISNICTVFAESEVISLIAEAKKRENIIAGIHNSVSVRISGMAAQVNLTAPVMMTGGVAKNIGIVKAIEKKLNAHLEVRNEAQFTGAIGAAVIAAKKN